MGKGKIEIKLSNPLFKSTEQTRNTVGWEISHPYKTDPTYLLDVAPVLYIPQSGDHQ